MFKIRDSDISHIGLLETQLHEQGQKSLNCCNQELILQMLFTNVNRAHGEMLFAVTCGDEVSTVDLPAHTVTPGVSHFNSATAHVTFLNAKTNYTETLHSHLYLQECNHPGKSLRTSSNAQTRVIHSDLI